MQSGKIENTKFRSNLIITLNYRNMRKIYMILLMVFALSHAAYSQQNKQDVVYLKNGSIIRGIITEQIPNVSIKIETADGSIFVLKVDEIENVAKEELQPVNNEVKPTPEITPVVDVKDYGSHFSMGVSMGGGGIIGMPIRMFLHRNIPFEVAVQLHPILFIQATNNNGTTSLSSIQLYPDVLFTGEFDFFFSRKYVPNKRVRLSGMFIKGGYAYGSRFDGYMGALGWQYERFKINHKNNSFSFGLGAGLMVLDDKEARPHLVNNGYSYNWDRPQEYYYKPMLYWRVAWNFFIRTKKPS
jgi:hypothetical protein